MEVFYMQASQTHSDRVSWWDEMKFADGTDLAKEAM